MADITHNAVHIIHTLHSTQRFIIYATSSTNPKPNPNPNPNPTHFPNLVFL